MEHKGIQHSPILRSSGDQGSVKGILKRSSTAQSEQQPADENTPRLRWDEENLMITEAQKDSTMRIDEPRTPFVYYDHELDRVIDPEDVFTLDGPQKRGAALAHTPPVPSYLTGLNEDDDDGDEDDDDDGERDPDEWSDSGDEDNGGKDNHTTVDTLDHERFAKLRSEHYNMREAMRLGQQLTEDENDD